MVTIVVAVALRLLQLRVADYSCCSHDFFFKCCVEYKMVVTINDATIAIIDVTVIATVVVVIYCASVNSKNSTIATRCGCGRCHNCNIATTSSNVVHNLKPWLDYKYPFMQNRKTLWSSINANNISFELAFFFLYISFLCLLLI